MKVRKALFASFAACALVAGGSGAMAKVSLDEGNSGGSAAVVKKGGGNGTVIGVLFGLAAIFAGVAAGGSTSP